MEIAYIVVTVAKVIVKIVDIIVTRKNNIKK